MVDFNVRVVVDPTGARRGSTVVRRNLQDIERQARRSNNAISEIRSTLRGLGGAIAGAFSVREVIQASDAFINARNRVQLYSDSVEETVSTHFDLIETANNTRIAATSLTSVYGRLALVQNELGASSEELATFSEAVAQAVTISGGTAQSAAGALLQLSQALGAGVVRAEEFNSILEGAPRIALAAAAGIDEAGGSVARLRNLVLEGQITSDQFFQAILEQAPQLAEEFSRIDATVGSSLTVLRNGFEAFAATVLEYTGINFILVNGFQALGNALTAVAEFYQRAFTTAFEYGRAVLDVIDNHTGFRDVLSGLGELIVDAWDVGTDAVGDYAEALGTGILDAYQLIISTTSGVAAAIVNIWDRTTSSIEDFFVNLTASITGGLQDFVNSYIRDINAFSAAINEAFGRDLLPAIDQVEFATEPAQSRAQEGGETLGEAFDRGFANAVNVREVIGEIGDAVGSVLDEIEAQVQRNREAGLPVTRDPRDSAPAQSQSAELTDKQATALQNLLDTLNPLQAVQQQYTDQLNLLNQAFLNGRLGITEYDRNVAALSERYRTLLDPVAALQEELAQERRLIGLSNDERQIAAERIRVENQLKMQGVDISTQAAQAVINEAEAVARLSQQVEASPFRQFQEQILTTSQRAETAFLSTFSSIEDALTNFVRTGELNFEQLASTIISEITRILIIRPLIQGLTSSIGGFLGFGGFADGGVFNNGAQVTAFQRGGVVDAPTFFPMAGGRTGLMGEAGPEAILPLRRGPSGRLGVQVTGGAAGGGNINYAPSIQLNFNAPASQGDQQADREFAEMASRLVRREIDASFEENVLRQQRPGGQLNRQGTFS